MNPQVDRHGSHEFIEWQHEKQLLHKQMKLRNSPKVDQHGSQEFVEWQQKQQELYKEMNGVAEKVSDDAFHIVQSLRDITGQTLRTKFMV
jgi:Txe/YoeB family toxin of Txe-Axe toxin-antitoxin module